jgi:hypothetical protein
VRCCQLKDFVLLAQRRYPRKSPLQSWRLEESQIESPEHQDNANIHYQPFPESVSEESEIYTDYNGYHRQHVKHDGYLSAHLQHPSARPLVGFCTVTYS